MRCILPGLLSLSLLGAPPVPMALGRGEAVPARGGRGEGIGAMVEGRQDFAMTSLPDGRVLVTGGGARPSSECFVPAKSAFVAGPALVQARAGHRALPLKDGRVLLLGGTEPAQAAEVLDLGAGTSLTLKGEARFGLSAEAALLDDGRVLMVDGGTGKTWLWDGTKEPSLVGTLTRPRLLFRLTALKEGQAVVTGGLPAGKVKGDLPAEVFKGRWRGWSTVDAPLAARARHQATAMPDGTVLLWGGHGADPKAGTRSVERLDVAKERVKAEGELHASWGIVPAWTGTALIADGSREARILPSLDGLPALLREAAGTRLVLGDAYQEPQAAITGERLLVLGSTLAGPSLERWDPKLKACLPMGALRHGAEGLVVLADKRIAVLGPVVDVLDPKTGTLKPLGWREDVEGLLKKAKGPEAPGKAFAAWPQGGERKGAVVVPLDKTRALVVGGSESGAPGTAVSLWVSGKKATLSPAGTLGTARAFKGTAGAGALKAQDGSVLVWGGLGGE